MEKIIYFKLFATCIIVKGASTSLIYDLERIAFYDLSNSFLDILKLSKTKSISEIKTIYNNADDKLIDSFFAQFVSEEIGFYTDDPKLFPELSCDWESPFTITNCIIEVEKSSTFNFESVINQLNELSCRAVQLRLLSVFSITDLKSFLNTFNNSKINHLEILMPYTNEVKNSDFFGLYNIQPRLNRIMLYSSEEDKIEKDDNNTLIYFKKDIRIDSSEVIKVERFNTNIEIFSEANHFNLGLNRKVCINKEGEIKNYLNHTTTFGNIETKNIKDVVGTIEFQEKWTISNDKIEVCKKCQYRYACVSNSDIKKENNKYFKIDMCKFNPILNVWKEYSN
jgi:SPASM domain peptide maturase of grasp-with-spasm system